MKIKIIEVWDTFPALKKEKKPGQFRVIVRDSYQHIYYADFDPENGTFHVIGSADADALPQLAFDLSQGTDLLNVTVAKWVSLYHWRACFSPEILEIMERRQELKAILFIGLAILVVFYTLISPSQFPIIAVAGFLCGVAAQILISLRKYLLALAFTVFSITCLLLSVLIVFDLI